MNNANPPVQESNNIHFRTDILEEFGLNRNDIKVYNALLILGRTKTGRIIKETRVASSRVYASLQQLINKGLVSYQVINNVKYYQAELPHQFIEDVEKNTATLKEVAKELKNFPVLHTPRNETNVFEGVRGLKMAYAQHTENYSLNETVSIIAFVGPEFKNSPELRTFFSETVDRTMIKKKCKGRLLTNTMINSIIKKDRPDSSIYTIKYLSSKYTLPYSLNISKKEVMMSVWNDKPIVFCIKNPVVVAAFQKNFDYLWGLAKK